MKTYLEDKIRTHRDAFDDQLPPEGHLERFVEKRKGLLGGRAHRRLRFIQDIPR